MDDPPPLASRALSEERDIGSSSTMEQVEASSQLERAERPNLGTSSSSPHSTPIRPRSSSVPTSSPLLPEPPRISREDGDAPYCSPPTSPLRSESPFKEATRPATPEVEASSPSLNPSGANQNLHPTTEVPDVSEVFKTPVSKRFRPFVTPSRVVKTISTSDSNVHALNSINKRRQASSSPPSSPLLQASPPLQFYKPPSKKQKRLAFSTPSFTSPASKFLQSSSSTSTSETRQSQAIELTRLEGRLVLLKQARRYQKENDEIGQKGDHELTRLCEVWKEAGKAVIELLWEHSSAFVDPTQDSPISHSFSTSWGFSSSPSRSTFASNSFNNSWGFSSSPSAPSGSSSFSTNYYNSEPQETTAEFMQKVDAEALRNDMTREDALRELESGELPSLDSILRERKTLRGARTGANVQIAIKAEQGDDLTDAIELEESDEHEEEEEKEEEEDLPSPASSPKNYSESDTFESLQALLDSEAGDSPSPTLPSPQEEEAKEWNLGKLMKMVGVDPEVFGWDEEQEDFL